MNAMKINIYGIVISYSILVASAFFLILPAPTYAQSSFPAKFDLSTLDGSNGFVIKGKGQFGKYTKGVGDVNGDGIDDFAIRRTAVEKGEIIYGRTTGYPSLASLQALGNTGGKSRPQVGGDPTTPGPLNADVTVVDGSGNSTDTGSQIRVIADINGDGQKDLVVTQPFVLPDGRASILYGTSSPASGNLFPASTDLDTLTDTEGFFISGFSTSGDLVLGSDDDVGIFFIGVKSGNSAAPVNYLRQSTFSPGSPPPAGVTDVSMWGAPGSPGGRITGGDSTALFGAAIDVGPAATSFTGNNTSVLAIGAPADTRFTSTDQGHVYVIFDPDTALPAGGTFDIATLDGSNGFVLEGDMPGDELGFDVEFILDVNGDGRDDLIFGIPGDSADAGMACVIYGSTTSFPALLHPSDLDGTNGTCIGGFNAGDRAGESVCGIADLDSDGLNETCIGAPNTDSDDGAGGVLTDAGATYVVEIQSFTSAVALDVSGLDGANGFTIPGLGAGDELGTDCTSPGDINGDGVADLSCGAPFADSNKGKDYVICGLPPQAAHTLQAALDLFTFTEDSGDSGQVTGNLFGDNGSGVDLDSNPAHFTDFTVFTAGENEVESAASDILDAPDTIVFPLGSVFAPKLFEVPLPNGKTGAANVTINSDGSITLDTAFSFDPLGPNDSVTIGNPLAGEGGMAYRMTDNHGLTSDANIVFTITGVNDPPKGIPIVVTEDPTSHISLGIMLNANNVDVFDIETIDHSTDKFEWFDSNGILIKEGKILDTGALPNSAQQQLIGKTVTVKYSYTDKGGTDESVTSAPFGPFKNPELTVFKTGLGSGDVTSPNGGIDCGPICQAEYDFFTTAVLSQLSDTGSHLSTSSLPPDKFIIMDTDKTVVARFELTNPTPTTVVSSALPSARSGQAPASGPDDPEKAGTSGSGPSRPSAAGDPITVFYTAINAGADPAQSCSVTIGSGAPVTLSFQPTDATNAPVGSPDQPFDMNAGEVKTFVLSFTPVSVTTGIEVFPNVVCDNASVSPISGVNGVFLTISDQPVPDVLSIGATVSNDGIIRIDSAGGSGFMSASALNIGVGDNGTAPDPANPTANTAVMTISADTGGVTLPLVMGVCALNAQGACINPPSASVDVNVSNQAATMAVFVTATGAIALDPATNRVFLRFVGADGITRSITSAAITAP
jgi:FG-GAP repeat